jgi:hypothetical protein
MLASRFALSTSIFALPSLAVVLLHNKQNETHNHQGLANQLTKHLHALTEIIDMLVDDLLFLGQYLRHVC